MKRNPLVCEFIVTLIAVFSGVLTSIRGDTDNGSAMIVYTSVIFIITQCIVRVSDCAFSWAVRKSGEILPEENENN